MFPGNRDDLLNTVNKTGYYSNCIVLNHRVVAERYNNDLNIFHVLLYIAYYHIVIMFGLIIEFHFISID
jgi:hypothetical protein